MRYQKKKTYLKTLIFSLSVFLVSLLLLLFLIFLIQVINDQNKEEEERQVYNYQSVTVNTLADEKSFGKATLFDLLKPDDSVSYEENGIHTVISHFGMKVYQCTGTCICEKNRRRRNLVEEKKTEEKKPKEEEEEEEKKVTDNKEKDRIEEIAEKARKEIDDFLGIEKDIILDGKEKLEEQAKQKGKKLKKKLKDSKEKIVKYAKDGKDKIVEKAKDVDVDKLKKQAKKSKDKIVELAKEGIEKAKDVDVDKLKEQAVKSKDKIVETATDSIDALRKFGNKCIEKFEDEDCEDINSEVDGCFEITDDGEEEKEEQFDFRCSGNCVLEDYFTFSYATVLQSVPEDKSILKYFEKKKEVCDKLSLQASVRAAANNGKQEFIEYYLNPYCKRLTELELTDRRFLIDLKYMDLSDEYERLYNGESSFCTGNPFEKTYNVEKMNIVCVQT